MVGFNPKSTIADPEKLFGRGQLMGQLVNHIKRNNIVQVIGLRRYGKTSLLKCLEVKLSLEHSDKVIPIYVDFKEEGAVIKGTANVYRYLIARVCEKLTQGGILSSEIEIKRVKLVPCDDWVDCYESMEEVSGVRLQGLFKAIINWFAEYTGCTFYFLFDEYETLFRYTFDSPVGFMTMRSLSSQSSENGNAPLGFIIAGTLTFEHLCTITGSGELNVVTDTVYVPPLSKDDFLAMWTSECDRVGQEAIPLKKEVNFFFEASGGVPFYAKLLAEAWIVSGEKPTYQKLVSYFEEVYQNLTIEEHALIKGISTVPKKVNQTVWRDQLISKGIILIHAKDQCRLGSSFFNEYLDSKRLDQGPYQTEKSEIEKKVEAITKLIKDINSTSRNKGEGYIFEPTNNDAVQIQDLNKVCVTEDLFANFSISLYQILFERTKGTKRNREVTLANLPDAFSHENEFIKIVDILRHSFGKGHLMDKFTLRPNQLSKAQMLELLTGSKNEPTQAEEFMHIQITLLERFEKELIRLLLLLKRIG